MAAQEEEDKHKRPSYFGTGREFYDDGYGSESDVESVEDTLDFASHDALHVEALASLQAAYDRHIEGLSSADASSSICLLEGASGTGKSTLFQNFVDEIQSNSNNNKSGSSTYPEAASSASSPPMNEITHNKRPYILRGKFNHGGEDPLSAIAEAFGSLATTLMRNHYKEKENGASIEELDLLRHRITKNIGGHKAATRLGSILPSLNPLLISEEESALAAGNENDIENNNNGKNKNESFKKTLKDLKPLGSSSNNSGTMSSQILASTSSRADSSHARNRLKYMFRALTEAICSTDHPVILFLDDFHCCDTSSLKVIKAILLDKDITNLFFVVSTRTAEEIDASKSWSSQWKTIQKDRPDIITISVTNISLEGVLQFLKAALRWLETDDEAEEQRILEFAKALYSKTRGNIFFTKQVLEEMLAKNLLSFSRVTFAWEWNLDNIDKLDNILQAVTQRIHTSTSPTLQNMLTTAAYMRNTIGAKALQRMMDLQGNKIAEEELMRELDNAVTEGFFKRVATIPSTSKERRLYCFSHDKIKEAAFDMVPEGKTRDEYKHGIGLSLYEMSHDPDLAEDWMVLSAADHLSVTSPSAANDHDIFLCKLNLEAGQRCVSVAAFESASKYLNFGIERLKATEHPWQIQYDLTMEIMTVAVDAELSRGNWEVGEKLAEEVFENARTTDDQLPTLVAFAKALGRKKSHLESFETSLKALHLMGFYPTSSLGVQFNAVRDLLYVRRYFRNTSDDAILELPESHDIRLGLVLDLFMNAAHQSFFCNRSFDFVALTLKALRLSLQHGRAFMSGRVFMTYFIICDVTGDYEGARRFADLGLEIASHYPEKGMNGYLIYLKTVFLDSWNKSHDAIAELYEQSYKRSVQVGDFESALISRASSLDHEFLAGRSLALLDIKFADLIEKEEMYCASMVNITAQQRLPIRHLLGSSDEPLDFENMVNFDKDISENFTLTAGFAARLTIAVFWGNYEFAEKILSKAGTVSNKSYTAKIPRLYYVMIVYNTLYRTTGRRSYRKQGKAAASEMRKLTEAKGKNSLHRCTIASAHVQACSRRKKTKRQDTLSKYDEGIKAALDSMHKQDAALASQLAAEYIVWCDATKTELIASYLKRAITWYSEWGATNLVRHLEQKYQVYLGHNRMEEAAGNASR